METAALFEKYVVPTYGRFPLSLARGEGCRVWDEAGAEYLDFGAGIAVCSIGHSHPRMVEALTRQASRLIHTSNLYLIREQALLAQRLVECVGHPGKVFFCNSGAEANEALYKLARKFGNEAVPPAPTHTVGELVAAEPRRHGIVTFDGSFHGRTLAGIAATGQAKVKKGYEPMVEGFSHAPFNDMPGLLAAVSPGLAGILLEPIQGERGVHPATQDFLRSTRTLCDERSALLMFDEVQCGLGRTGDWAGWRSLGADDVVPDAVSWAKGIAGGFPMGAIWVRDRPIDLKSDGTISLADLLGPGSHGTTFGGTPLACVVATAVLDVIEEENLLQNARDLGAFSTDSLTALGSRWIAEVRGVGLMLGIELVQEFPASEGRAPSLALVDRLQAAGLLVVPSGTHAIRWLPPLNVARAEIERAVDILGSVLQKTA